MATLVEGSKPFSAGDGINIDSNKVISVLLREENNLIMVNEDRELYTDLQFAPNITSNSEFPVGVTVGKVLEADGWEQSGIILNWKTTSGDYARWIYGVDGEIYFDGGTGEWKQVYYSSEVDDLFTALRNELHPVAFSGDYNDLENKPTIGNGLVTIQKNGATVEDFGVNDTTNTTVNITMDKTDVGLGNVDNTSDLDKPISTATQNALDLKANSADLATVATTGSYTDLINTPTIGDGTITIQKNGTAVDTFTTNQTSAKSINITMDKSDVGLSNVDNTSDANKPISTATQTALDGKQATLVSGTNIKTINNTSVLGSGNIDTNQVSDSAYSSSWDGVTDKAPSKNAVYDKINGIDGLIPSAATTSNQLADKNYVDDSINSVTAYYITKNAQGDAFATYAELSSASTFYSGGVARTPTRNDYCIVLADENHSNEVTRYSYQGTQWEYQYTVNESPMTQAQLDALNSGITSTKVGQYDTAVSTIAGYGDIVTHDASEFATAAQGSLADTAVQPGDLATVATTGAYSDLSGTPNLATVATSGSYSDLSNKPTIPTVNDAALTITQNGTSKGTFTANQSTAVTIELTDTTYTRGTATSGGTTLSLVNTGDMYNWNNKQNALTAQTAYTSKGTASKVPQITTNTLGQVTGITEVNISYPSQVSDTAYASTWNGVTATAPSQNAVYDKINAMDTTISGKQDTLVNQTNIKSVNGNSLLGSGDLVLHSGTTASLTVNGWSSNTQTVTVSGVTASNYVIVSPAPASLQDYTDAKIYCSAQGSNSLTFTCDSVPSSAITVNIMILN